MEKFKLIPRANLIVSPTNPRKHFPEVSLNELAASLKAAGIIEPLVVRPVDIPGNEMYEIVCGERRYRAATIAEIDQLPCMVRELTDDQVFDIQITENLQREDVNPLDEAEAYMTLVSKKGHGLEELAVRFGKSTDYVFGRMRLVNLIADAKQYLENGTLPVTAAIRISLLSESHQAAAIKRTILPVTVNGESKKIFSGLRDLKSFTDNNVLMPLKSADFDINDATLLPCGSCDSCPKRTGNNLYKEFSDTDRCLDSDCYKQKHVAHYQRLQKKLSSKLKMTIGFAARHYAGEKEFPELDAIPMLNWTDIDEKEAKKNKNARYVVFVGVDHSGEDQKHGWVEVKAPKADRVVNAPSKEDVEKENAKRERERLKDSYFVESVFEQFKDLKHRGLSLLSLRYLVANTWDDIMEFPQVILLDIVKRYSLEIKCQVMPGYSDAVISADTELNPDISYSIDIDDLYNSLGPLTAIKLQTLLNELVFIDNIRVEGFQSFYEINVKAASKNAVALLKQREKEKV